MNIPIETDTMHVIKLPLALYSSCIGIHADVCSIKNKRKQLLFIPAMLRVLKILTIVFKLFQPIKLVFSSFKNLIELLFPLNNTKVFP